MPNGRRRQQNTAHANRQRALQQAADSIVEGIAVFTAPLVVEAEAMGDVRSAEITKLKKQIIGLKKKNDNLGKKNERLVGEIRQEVAAHGELTAVTDSVIKELRDDEHRLRRSYEASIKGANDTLNAANAALAKKTAAWREIRPKVDQMTMLMAVLVKEFQNPDIILNDVDGPGGLDDQLEGVDIDKLADEILGRHRFTELMAHKARDNPDDAVDYTVDGHLYSISYQGPVVLDKITKVMVPVVGTPKENFKKMNCREAMAEAETLKQVKRDVKKMEKMLDLDLASKWVVPGGCWGEY
tara:strand:- start:142 stop:1035 length:894 start_codon:yes stop_codon:yes gene_type:complete